MKTRLRIPKLAIALLVLCSAFATASMFGQTIFWIGIPGTLNGNNFGVSSNWSNGTTNPVSPGPGTLCQFVGAVPGTVNVISVDGIDHAGTSDPIGNDFGADGVSIELTSTQISPVNLYATNDAVGMGLDGIKVDAGAGQFTIGDNNGGELLCVLRPSGGTHIWENDSTNPLVIMPGLQLQNGGGNAHEIDFKGTGDFAITNNIRNNNNAPANSIQFFNTGTTTWTAGGINDRFNDAGLANVTINPGSILIIETNGLLPITSGNTLTHNGNLLKFDAVTTARDTFNFPINGTGLIQWNGGTWTLTSSASTYTGSNLLTGGELVANGIENAGVSGPLGVGNVISFQGGTLGYNVNNAFDYSSRFDTSANQAYSIDTGGQTVTYATGLGSSGGSLSKLGAGTLTLTGTSTYSGPTTISAGELVFQDVKSGAGSITVADGAALGIFVTGTQVAPASLTLGGVAGCTLEFNNVNSTSTAPLAAGTLSSTGTITINVDSGTFAPGQNYPLLSWTSGTPPAVNLGFVSGVLGNLITNGNAIELNITALADHWNGTNGGNWTAVNNWVSGGVPATYVDPVPVVFDDTAAGTLVVTVDTLVQPQSVVFNNNTNAYTITSSAGNNIGGSASLVVAGSGTVTLSGGANTYTGVTTLSGGTVLVTNLANGGSVSDIGAAPNAAGNLVFSGGILEYFGGSASIDRLFTLGPFGGTIDNEGNGALTLNNTGVIGMTGVGPRGLTLAGVNVAGDTFAGVLHDGGGATSLTMQGPGTWILTGNNGYSGMTTISGGTLQVGVGAGSGTLGNGTVIDNGALVFNRTGNVTVAGAVSGTGTVTQNGTGAVILAGNNSYAGATTINAGTLQVGNGGATGLLGANSPIVDNGTFIFNSSNTLSLSGFNAAISGTGNVIVRGGGTLQAVANNTYTGWTEIDPGATFQPCRVNSGQLLSSVVTNNGTLLLVRQDNGVFGYSNSIVGSGRLIKDVSNHNPGDVTLVGSNTYSGNTIIAGGYLILGDGVTPGAGTISSGSRVIFTNSSADDTTDRGLIFNRPDNFSFNNLTWGATAIGGLTGNPGALIKMNTNIVTLTGSETYQGGTVISNGTLVVDGSIGSGPVNDQATLALNVPAGTLNFGMEISGPGVVIQEGAGRMILSGNNTNLTGSITVSNGLLAITSGTGGDVNVSGGTFAPGGFQSTGTMTIGGNLNISSGTVSMTLNKALAQSNSFVNMTNVNAATAGVINFTNGTLQLIDLGPILEVGDRFVLFSEAIAGGGSIPITTSGGFTVNNNLGLDGSVTVATVVQPAAPTITRMTLANRTNLIMTATNNFGPGGRWDLLATNILTAPLMNWPVVQSGNFDTNGNLTLTNTLGTNAQQFFDLRAP